VRRGNIGAVTSRRTLQHITGLAFAASLVVALAAPVAHAEVYKCQGAEGKTVYADAPCASGGKPLRLADPTTPSGAANPTACTQLLDETRRLAAEADRDAKRGLPVNVANAKRRQALSGEYQRRCAGISRSAP
jgi:hypothetical protein